MGEKTVAQKARVKPGVTVAVINRVPGVVESLGLPMDAIFVEPRSARLVLLFVNSRAELESHMPSVVDALASDADLWVFYRKGSNAAGLDMNRDDVWAIAEKKGLRPLGLVSVDQAWSAFRLRPSA